MHQQKILYSVCINKINWDLPTFGFSTENDIFIFMYFCCSFWNIRHIQQNELLYSPTFVLIVLTLKNSTLSHFIYLILDVSWNISISHTAVLAKRACSRFFLQLTRYITHFLTHFQWWANHKSNRKSKSQIIGKNDLNQNLKSKIKSQIIKSNPNHFRSKSNQITNQFHHSVNFSSSIISKTHNVTIRHRMLNTQLYKLVMVKIKYC